MPTKTPAPAPAAPIRRRHSVEFSAYYEQLFTERMAHRGISLTEAIHQFVDEAVDGRAGHRRHGIRTNADWIRQRARTLAKGRPDLIEDMAYLIQCTDRILELA